MAIEYPIPTVLQMAKICQYLNVCKSAKNLALKGADLDPQRARLIYMERSGIQRLFDLNPNDSTLRNTANYLFSLLRYESQALQIINNQSANIPVITGPANQSVNVGDTAVFSVSVTGTSPFTYQWFLNSIPIPGATSSSYSKTNAQVSDSGGLYSVQVSNAASPSGIFSNVATLTVTAHLVGYFYQGNTDYSIDLLAGTDNVAYLGTFNISNGQPFTVMFPDVGADEFIVVKYPVSEPVKTNYLNPPPSGPDAGIIPSLALDSNSFGGWNYIFSRTGNQFGLNSINGHVQFS